MKIYIIFSLVIVTNFCFAQIQVMNDIDGSVTLLPKGIKSSEPINFVGADTTNVSLGNNALERNVRALGNVAIGRSALRFMNFANTGVPYYTDNVAIGDFALENNQPNSSSTGKWNVAVGYSALRDNTRGTGNTAVGSRSSENISIGNYNSSMGYMALHYYKKSNFNTAIGTLAMGNTADTSFVLDAYNTAFGHEALYGGPVRANNVGVRNTAIGARSLYNISSGSNNTALGFEAGFNITTGSGNLLIGNYAGGTTNVSNKLFIANSNTNNPLIKGDFNTAQVKINSKLKVGGTSDTPLATLHVDGDLAITGFSVMNTDQIALNHSLLSTVKVNGGGTRTLSGIDGGVEGMLLFIWVEDGTNLIIVNNAVGVANATDWIETGSVSNLTITNGGAVTLMYDFGSFRWRVLSSRD